MIKYEISNEVPDLLRSLFIKQYESELYHQHQNKAEPHGVVKRIINTLMNLTEPSSLLAIMSFVCLQPSECYSITCPWRPHPHSSSDWTCT